ncbi:peptidase S10 [Labrys miyagiensis]|uniref:Peptidase S10 n=1 Tax=Labrys miyagiensis TaxID=346912 RepID=A0ABQ6CBI9_9HYPH|nr:peptidase S10 [Labrys miyagiensis]GLS17726.1 peptidase S10 [Labrys miyagiensis]
MTLVVIFVLGTPGWAQDAAPAAPAAKAERGEDRDADRPPSLPSDSITHHTVSLAGGRVLSLKATAGSLRLRDEKGHELAQVGYIAYELDGAEAGSRPVTFVFNGGPGAGSAWLNIGAIGPWRLPMEAGKIYPSAPPVLVDNQETWLDFTDLVFIDPPGTGYSRITATGDDVRKSLWSVEGDIQALTVVVRRWLAQNQRLESPKFIAGESYGGFRGPRLAEELAMKEGIGINGLVLISPALDFSADDGAFYWLDRLPAYTAAHREQSGPVTREQLADVERYAIGDYLQDYLRGPRDMAAVARMVQRVTELTGLDPALVKRLGGRIDKTTFQREILRPEGKVVGFYDATVSAYDPEPASNYNNWHDPALEGVEAPMTSAIMDLYNRELGWKTIERYEILNGRVGSSWEWGDRLSPPSSMDALRGMLALDPHFRVLVTGGLTDIQVPYFQNKRLLDQVPDYGPPGRLQFKVYGGGHMFYSRDDSRKALHEDARTLVAGP